MGCAGLSRDPVSDPSCEIVECVEREPVCPIRSIGDGQPDRSRAWYRFGWYAVAIHLDQQVVDGRIAFGEDDVDVVHVFCEQPSDVVVWVRVGVGVGDLTGEEHSGTFGADEKHGVGTGVLVAPRVGPFPVGDVSVRGVLGGANSQSGGAEHRDEAFDDGRLAGTRRADDGDDERGVGHRFSRGPGVFGNVSGRRTLAAPSRVVESGTVRLEITRRAELAVRALVALAEADRAASLGHGGPKLKGAELADRLGTTLAFCGQVVTPLVQAGWVRSDPGPTGGYRLAASAEGVNVLEVIEAVDGPTDDGRCVVAGACDPGVPCLLHRAWHVGREELWRVLAEVSVASLVQPIDVATAAAVSGR